MKTKIAILALALAGMTGLVPASRAQTVTNFSVTTPSSQFAYVVNGTNLNPSSPTLNLPAGATYTFMVNTSAIHPMDITTNTSFPFLNSAFAGASPQNISLGTVTLTIPATGFPSTLFYICNQHGFFGQINVLPPAPPAAPPRNMIISITLAPTNVTLKSTGTNTSYIFTPEFNSNLVSGTWQSVPVFSNVFANGTNTTSFGRLEPFCGSNVFLRISQRPPG